MGHASLEQQIVFTGGKRDKAGRTAARFDDEWLASQLADMRQRLTVRDPELLSDLNALAQRVTYLENVVETLLGRIKRLERKDA